MLAEAKQPPLAVLASFSGDGGVERMLVNLLEEFVALGVPIDLLLLRERGGHVKRIPEGVRMIRLGTPHSLAAVPAIARYLRRTHPNALLAAKDRAGRAALLARKLAGVDTRIVIRLGTNLSAALEGKSSLRYWARRLPMQWIYPRADRVIAVSEGVAEDTCRMTGIPRERISVIRNPVINRQMLEMASEAVPHPWLEDSIPVVMGSGRMNRQKDFHTLIRAFARVRARMPLRLIILGEGADRPDLETLAKDLGVDADVLMPGFVVNPYAWVSRASLFVLSSRWEGSPNVLTEALALGVPVVSTDCPSGPAEVLREGRIAPLVPIGDDEAMAGAMEKVLQQPPAVEILKGAVDEYRAEISARHYLQELHWFPPEASS